MELDAIETNLLSRKMSFSRIFVTGRSHVETFLGITKDYQSYVTRKSMVKS